MKWLIIYWVSQKICNQIINILKQSLLTKYTVFCRGTESILIFPDNRCWKYPPSAATHASTRFFMLVAIFWLVATLIEDILFSMLCLYWSNVCGLRTYSYLSDASKVMGVKFGNLGSHSPRKMMCFPLRACTTLSFVVWATLSQMWNQ